MMYAFRFEYEFCCFVLGHADCETFVLRWCQQGGNCSTTVSSKCNTRQAALLPFQKWYNDVHSTNFQIGRATEITHLQAHCHTRIEKDTKFFFLFFLMNGFEGNLTITNFEVLTTRNTTLLTSFNCHSFRCVII